MERLETLRSHVLDLPALWSCSRSASRPGRPGSRCWATTQPVEIVVFVPLILFGLSRAGAWVLGRTRHNEDAYFVLMLGIMAVAGVLAKAIDLPDIVGAFLAGLAVNAAVAGHRRRSSCSSSARPCSLPPSSSFRVSSGAGPGARSGSDRSGACRHSRCCPGRDQAPDAAWPAVGKRLMSQPSSATIVSAMRRATPGMVSRRATAAAAAAVHVATDTALTGRQWPRRGMRCGAGAGRAESGEGRDALSERLGERRAFAP